MAREHCSVTHGDATIEFEIRRSDRRTKTVEVAVTPLGVRVYAPRAAPVAELKQFVEAKAPWILGHLADLERACLPGLREGQIMPYLGRAVPLSYETGELPGPVVDFDGCRFTVTVPPGGDDDTRLLSVGHTFVAWYKRPGLGADPGHGRRLVAAPRPRSEVEGPDPRPEEPLGQLRP